MESISYHHALAFNYALFAVVAPHRQDDHTILRVDKWSSQVAKNLPDRIVDDLTPTAAERAIEKNNTDTELALWVGMRPEKASWLRATEPKDLSTKDAQLVRDAKASKNSSSKTKGDSVNTLAKHAQTIPHWKQDTPMARVVVKYAHTHHMTFYELRNRNASSGVRLSPNEY